MLPDAGYGVHGFGCGVGKADSGVTRGKPYILNMYIITMARPCHCCPPLLLPPLSSLPTLVVTPTLIIAAHPCHRHMPCHHACPLHHCLPSLSPPPVLALVHPHCHHLCVASVLIIAAHPRSLLLLALMGKFEPVCCSLNPLMSLKPSVVCNQSLTSTL